MSRLEKLEGFRKEYCPYGCDEDTNWMLDRLLEFIEVDQNNSDCKACFKCEQFQKVFDKLKE